MSLQYIIDGYNIINHPLFCRSHKHTEGSHSALLAFIKTKKITVSPKNKITVVFDGFPVSFGMANTDSNIEVIFSRKISADEKIKKIIEESYGRKNIIVVSDDKEIKFTIRSLGAECIGVEEFIFAKEKSSNRSNKDLIKPELTYSQMHDINEELRKIWLK